MWWSDCSEGTDSNNHDRVVKCGDAQKGTKKEQMKKNICDTEREKSYKKVTVRTLQLYEHMNWKPED